MSVKKFLKRNTDINLSSCTGNITNSQKFCGTLRESHDTVVTCGTSIENHCSREIPTKAMSSVYPLVDFLT